MVSARYGSPVKIREVHERWGSSATKWVWSARPRHVFEPDGTERDDLEPVNVLTRDDFSDETGWWTCHPNTRVGDLAVIYRSTGDKDVEGFPVRGPRDLRYVCLATSDAFALADEPLAGEFADKHGCRSVVVAEFEPPVGIAELRSDPQIRSWPALRAGFVRAAMPMPNDVWARLVEISEEEPDGPGGPVPPDRAAPPLDLLERALETWLESHPDALRAVGLDVCVAGRQVHLPGHDGTVDLLMRRTDRPNSYVAVELKAGEIRRDAIAQVLGYIGWLTAHPDVEEASGLVIGLDPHIQVPWVLSAIAALVDLAHWRDLDVPADLGRRLELHRRNDRHRGRAAD